MPEIVTTPMSYFEALIEYERPSIRLWLERSTVIQAIFDAFAPWNIDVDDVDVLTTGKNSEQGIKFRLPEKRVSFFSAQPRVGSRAIVPAGKLQRRRLKFSTRP
jgi:hypothetical protein